MFNTNTKPDSKIRFQNRTFKRQLRLAREHKRQPVNRQPNGQRKFSATAIKIGLLAGLVFLLFIYFVYLPNPLDIKNINVSGLSQQQNRQLETLVKQYLSQNKFWPQKNITLLNKKSLVAFLLAKDPQITSIDHINKRLPHTLEVAAKARENRFLLTSPDGNFVLGNDNLMTVFENTVASSTLPRVNLLDAQGLNPGGDYPNPEQIAAISFLSQALPDLGNSPIDHYELLDITQSEITVYLKNGSKYLLDYKNNLSDTVNKLRLLLASIAPQDLKRLFYADMTIQNRGYVCLKGTPCATAPLIIPDIATSTASSSLDNINQ